jgi:xanthine/uracil permease
MVNMCFFIGFCGSFYWLMVLCNVSVPIGLYGFQHYLSMLGSLILIPLVVVPAMGGTYVSSSELFI